MQIVFSIQLCPRYGFLHFFGRKGRKRMGEAVKARFVILDGLINIMSQQGKHIAGFPSLIASLYAAWEEHKIPAIFYHYTLAVLAKKEKKEQSAFMMRELKQLKTGHHSYHIIADAIEARERSLAAIRQNIDVLLQNDNGNQLNWSNAEPQVQSQGFSLIYQSKGADRRENHKLVELINHLRMYQKLTFQVATSINHWESQLTREGYDSPIQFLYHHQDYLHKILTDTSDITNDYEWLFENNPFLIMKREHQSNELALVYKNLHFSHDFAMKMEEALQIISNHEAAIERYRILGHYKQYGSRKQIMRSQSLHKIYCNFNNNKDFLIVKDPYLKSDKLIPNPQNKFKYLNNRNVLINPDPNPSLFEQKKHPVLFHVGEQRDGTVSRSSSLSGIHVRKIKHKESIVIPAKLDPNEIQGKLMHDKLLMYESLDKTVKYTKPNKPARLSVPDLENEAVEKQSLIAKHEQSPKEEVIHEEIAFVYDSGISSNDIIKYLRDDIFRTRAISLEEMNEIAKKIISEKNYVALVKVKSGEKLAAWLVVKFLPKETSIKKTIDILFSFKFYRIPDYEQKLITQFSKKGYGVIRQKGQIVKDIPAKDPLAHLAIRVKYKVSSNVDLSVLKQVVKKNQCLRQSRILKYHYYSKDSKYHRYCQHSENACQIGYNFEEVFRVTISGQAYIRLRCDKIFKVGNCYKIYHHLNNTDLLIGPQLDDLMQFGNLSGIEFDSSFQEQQSQRYEYLCLPEIKLMHKYLHLTQKPLIAEYLTINGDVPELLSLQIDEKSVKSHLILRRPFAVSFLCRQRQDFGKSLAILSFS